MTNRKIPTCLGHYTTNNRYYKFFQTADLIAFGYLKNPDGTPIMAQLEPLAAVEFRMSAGHLVLAGSRPLFAADFEDMHRQIRIHEDEELNRLLAAHDHEGVSRRMKELEI